MFSRRLLYNVVLRPCPSGYQCNLTFPLSVLQPNQETVTTPDLSSLSSPLIDTERNLGLLLGLHASYLAMSTSLSPMEIECASESRPPLLSLQHLPKRCTSTKHSWIVRSEGSEIETFSFSLKLPHSLRLLLCTL